MGEEESKSNEEVAFDNAVTGSVGDGPIVGAAMRLFRNDGEELAQFESDSNANFNVTVRTDGQYYPLAIDSRGGTDLVTNSDPDFDLIGVVLEPRESSVANVNPFTTFVVELAADLPRGADRTNLQTAQNIVSSRLNNGLTSLATTGVMSTAIDGGNIAEIVRASEALGETVRRTRDALNSAGYAATGNDVLRAVASDLTDGFIDGAGGPRVNARFAAVWTVVSAQVLLETMANELHVNGGDATGLMSTAINLVTNENVSPTLADLDATNDMIGQSRVGIEAAFAVTSDTAVAELLDAANELHAGAGSSTVRNLVLPDDYRSRLNNAILLVAGGSNAVIDTVNEISRGHVLDPGSGSVTLTWVRPTHNDDGSVLTNLLGFKIYARQGSGSYSSVAVIDDSNATTYVVENLAPGTYEFVATSRNTTGVESSFSNPVTKVVE